MIRILSGLLILCVIYKLLKDGDILTPVREGCTLFIKLIQLVLTAILKLVQALIDVLSN